MFPVPARRAGRRSATAEAGRERARSARRSPAASSRAAPGPRRGAGSRCRRSRFRSRGPILSLHAKGIAGIVAPAGRFSVLWLVSASVGDQLIFSWPFMAARGRWYSRWCSRERSEEGPATFGQSTPPGRLRGQPAGVGIDVEAGGLHLDAVAKQRDVDILEVSSLREDLDVVRVVGQPLRGSSRRCCRRS